MTSRWQSAGFFVVRTPLLPVDVFRRLAADEGPAPSLLEDPAVAEALALASPAFWADLARTGDGGELDPRLRQTLVRYLVRMSTRCTPLGLMAGCSWGRVADEPSAVELSARGDYRRSTRPDVRFQSLVATEAVETSDAETLRGLLFRTHPDARVSHGIIRFSRLTHDVDGDLPELVEFSVDGPLALVLDRALDRVAGGDLVDALVAAGCTGDAEEAIAFIRVVVGAGLLLSELHPCMTASPGSAAVRWTGRGPDPLPPRRRRALEILRDVHGRALSDSSGSTAPSGDQPCAWFDDADADFGPGPVVDLWKPAVSSRLDAKVVEELGGALELLSRLSLWRPHPAIEEFRTRFLERYDEQWELDTLPLGRRRGVPLLEALDAETGIPFAGGASEDFAPLIDGLDFPSSSGGAVGAWTNEVKAHLLDAVVRHAAAQRIEWVLDDDDVRALATTDPSEFPDTAAVVASRCLVDDRPAWVVRGVSGPSAMGRIARFTAAEPDLLDAARRFYAAEEAERPEAVVVDFVHQPPGRAANLAVQPSLRRHECHLFGVGAEEGEVVRLEDLRLTLRAGVLTIFSAMTGLEVIPRLPSTYNHEISPFPLVRFIGALQHQRERRDLGWDWGALESAPFLPRVTHGGVVLAPARWRLSRRDLAGLVACDTGERLLREAACLRQSRGLPQTVGITHADLVLPIDLESADLLAQLVAVAGRDGEVELTEVLLDEGRDHLVRGPEGEFAHEVVVPFRRPRIESTRVTQDDRSAEVGDQVVDAARPTGSHAPLVYPPGSEWLYAEVYCGSNDVEAVLEALSERLPDWPVRRWFFVRFDEPSWHVRLRLQGDPAALLSDVVSSLGDMLAAGSLAGRVWRWTLDTYRPEVERYGGPSGLDVCHDIFHADSIAVTGLLKSGLLDDPSLRWQTALRAGDDLLTALGISAPDRLRLLETARDRFRWEHEADVDFVRAVGRQYRRDRVLVEEALAAEWAPAPGAHAVLAERVDAVSAAAGRLEQLWLVGELNRPVTGLAPSLLHMTFNRFLRSEHRAQETVLYDYLARSLRSRSARDSS